MNGIQALKEAFFLGIIIYIAIVGLLYLFKKEVTQTKRSAGQSVIASAAYQAGERLYNEYQGYDGMKPMLL